jgi:hypothetical protein
MDDQNTPADGGSLPLGYMASLEDWNERFAGRPMNMSDWNRLTCGEQQRYAAQECKTRGAIYKSKVSSNKISFEIILPASLTLQGLTESEAEGLERYLHRRLEEQVAAILQLRRMTGHNV